MSHVIHVPFSISVAGVRMHFLLCLNYIHMGISMRLFMHTAVQVYDRAYDRVSMRACSPVYVS